MSIMCAIGGFLITVAVLFGLGFALGLGRDIVELRRRRP